METLIATRKQSWLIWFLRGILLLVSLILFSRLFDLTIIRGSYYHSLSDQNRIRRIPVQAKRGTIYARGGEILAESLDIDVKKNDLAEFEDSEPIITEWQRTYPLNEAFAHAGGYLGEVSVDELGKIEGQCPEKGPRILGSFIGRSGLEEQYNCILTGIEGEELIETDASGDYVHMLGRRPAKNGDDLHTTIDFGLQKKVYELIYDKKGAIVVSAVDGEILASVSSPSFDPNVFVGSVNNSQKQNYLTDESLPLFNRVLGGIFHPGSVFKPIVAIASLEQGVIDEKFRYLDEGQITIRSIYGNFTYRNWYFTQYGGVEGEVDLTKALARSTDTFFYKVGELTGIDFIVKWSEDFGLNKKTGIDIPGEIEGLVPSPEWKIKTKGERWFLGNTYNMSIGQGDLATTPLAINSAISAIANKGKICKPHLVGSPECRQLPINENNVNLVKEGMKGACALGGTGYTFFDFVEKAGIDVACKTGTAENVNEDPHAWFTVFAPIEDPEIVATILIENGGEGSKVAGPIAREIFNYWFKVPITPTPAPND